MPKQAWLTPADEPGDYSRFLIKAPSLATSDWWSLLIGALLPLTDANNWEQSSDGLTPEEVAEIWADCLNDWLNQDVE